MLIDFAPPPPPPRLDFFLPEPPGRRLISIIGVRSRWRTLGSLTQRQPDREHEQRRNLISHERVERAIADLKIRERIRLLDAHA